MVEPATKEAIPPANIQTALLVGLPVKKRERSEAKEFVALIPRIIRPMPVTSRTQARWFFIISRG
jgi:hypothetical protein